MCLSAGLTGFSEEMKGLFDPCVDRVVELIQGQIQQVERKKNRVKVKISWPKNVKTHTANHPERLFGWRLR
jgi:hypothetical protein